MQHSLTARVLVSLVAFSVASPALADTWPSWIDKVTFEDTQSTSMVKLMPSEDTVEAPMAVEEPTTVVNAGEAFGQKYFRLMNGIGGRSHLQNRKLAAQEIMAPETLNTNEEEVTTEEAPVMQEPEMAPTQEPYYSGKMQEWPSWIAR